MYSRSEIAMINYIGGEKYHYCLALFYRSKRPLKYSCNDKMNKE